MTITTPSGQTFVMSDQDPITVELYSSLFVTDGELKGSFSYPGKAPLRENRALIGHGDLLEVLTDGQLFGLQVRIGNLYWTDVTMQYKVVDGDSIEFNLLLNLSLINDRLKNTLLSQVPFEMLYLGVNNAAVEAAMMASAVAGDWRVVPYVFAPVYNAEFAGAGDEPDVINTMVRDDLTYMNTMRYDLSLAKLVFNGPGYTYVKDGVTHGGYEAVPFFYLKYVLQGIIRWLGFVPGGSVFKDAELDSVVIYNINSLRAVASNGGGYYVAANEHLPAISVADFFKVLMFYPGFYPVLNVPTNTLSFNQKKDIDRFEVLDWTGKVKGVTEVTPVVAGGFKLSTAENAGNTPYDGEQAVMDEVVVGAGATAYEINAGTLGVFEDVRFGWTVPVDDEAGNVMDDQHRGNFTAPDDLKDFPLRLLFYNGMGTAGILGNYPALSNISTSGRRLSFVGDTGVYKLGLERFMSLVDGAKTIKADLLLNAVDLLAWADDKVVLLPSASNVLVPCLLSRLTFDAPQRDGQVIHAQAEGVVLGSVVYKAEAMDKPYLRVRYVDVVTGPAGSKAKLEFSLWQNRACTIPQDPDGVLFVDVVGTMSIKYVVKATNEVHDESGGSFSLRYLIDAQVVTSGYQIVTATADDGVNVAIWLGTFKVSESARYYLVFELGGA